VQRAHVDGGTRNGLSSAEREGLTRLRRQVRVRRGMPVDASTLYQGAFPNLAWTTITPLGPLKDATCLPFEQAYLRGHFARSAQVC
jgi:hypothetical protein